VHLRLNNMKSADNCFRQCMKNIPSTGSSASARYGGNPLNETTISEEEKDLASADKDQEVSMSDELLLEIGLEFLKHPEERFRVRTT